MQQKLGKVSSATLVSQILALNLLNKNQQKLFCSTVKNAKYETTHQFLLTRNFPSDQKKPQHVILILTY